MVLIWQGGGNKGGHFIHQLIWLPAVQNACEAPHITLASCFTLCFDLQHTHC